MRRDFGALKFFICIILITSIFSINIYSETEFSFSDLKTTDWFYKDVASLVEKAVINGYTDGTFRPGKSVSVAEFIKMSLVATNQVLIKPIGTSWYSKYVETAIAQGYISPTYYTNYQRAITRGEMGDIIDKILNLSYDNTSSYISRITDYNSVANEHKESSVDVYIAGIITGYSDGSIKSENLANRCEAAVVIVRMIDPARRNPPLVPVVSDSSSSNNDPVTPSEPRAEISPNIISSNANEQVSKCISVDGIEIGMSEVYVIQHLGEPEEKLPNQYGYEWFVYAGDYSAFKLLGIKDGKVVSIFSNINIDSTLGLKIGSTDKEVNIALNVSEFENYYYSIYDGMNIQLFSKKGVNDGIEGVLVVDSKIIHIMEPTRETIDSMERVIFHITNGARKANGLSPLLMSNQAKASSYSHSEDMGVNGFFAHENPSGEDAKTRMQKYGITSNYYAENIAAGYDNPFDFHYGLMHSSGHKKNILTERITHLGVGIYYDSSAKYKYYVTENFYEQR